jgi:hypothetical protein
MSLQEDFVPAGEVVLTVANRLPLHDCFQFQRISGGLTRCAAVGWLVDVLDQLSVSGPWPISSTSSALLFRQNATAAMQAECHDNHLLVALQLTNCLMLANNSAGACRAGCYCLQYSLKPELPGGRTLRFSIDLEVSAGPAVGFDIQVRNRTACDTSPLMLPGMSTFAIVQS